MSKRTKKLAKRNAQTRMEIGYIAEAGHDGDDSYGVNLMRYIELDSEDFTRALNYWEARRLAKLLTDACDRLDRMSK